jgi:uncharacterized protein
MSGLFVLPLGGLKEGGRTYNFEIGNAFFDQFDESEIKEGELIAVAELDKRSSHIDLKLTITGKVKISCDRCLESFFHPVKCENRILIKLGKNWDDTDPDMITIAADDQELDIKQFLYEFIHLALPIQRIHPNDKNGQSTCNPEMILKLEEHKIHEEQKTDPRWDELKKLMNNN